MSLGVPPRSTAYYALALVAATNMVSLLDRNILGADFYASRIVDHITGPCPELCDDKLYDGWLKAIRKL